jgi:hypothetical protein
MRMTTRSETISTAYAARAVAFRQPVFGARETIKARPWTVPVPVTADNFIRAETDMYFGAVAIGEGGFGKFAHQRELTPIDNQTLVRCNRDLFVSRGVFDLDAGPVTITLPNPGERFMSMLVIDQDHYVPIVIHGPGAHTFTKGWIGTRYVMIAVRFMVDASRPSDVQQVHALQDAIKVKQPSRGGFDVPKWDRTTRKRVRDALFALGATLPDLRNAYGTRERVDPARHLIGTAMGWGSDPDRDVFHQVVTPAKNDGVTRYILNVKSVPVDGFWSISVYNGDGYYEPNEREAYSLTNLTAKKDEDGSVTVRFGDFDRRTDNCLPIVRGWSYLVRLYRPRKEILSGDWTFPEAQPLSAS